MPIFIYTFIAFTLLYLLFEIHRLKKALNSIPVRILVNGTRGKTLTVRMMYQMFLQNQYKVNAKTTGDEPVLWKSNGQCEILRRRAPANIIENIRIIRRWAAENTQVAILECMALHPETQYTLAWRIFQPTHTFITNIGNDHFEAMGDSRAEMVDTIMQCVTSDNILFLPAEIDHSQFKTQKIEIFEPEKSPVEAVNIPQVVLNNHWGLMLSFVNHFNLDHASSVEIFRQEWQRNGERMFKSNKAKNFLFWNLFSVNDTDSMQQLITHIKPEINHYPNCIAIFNARKDRPLRSRSFSMILPLLPAETAVWITGSGRILTRKFFRKYAAHTQLKLVTIRMIIKKIRDGFAEETVLIGLGNSKGIESLIKEIEPQ